MYDRAEGNSLQKNLIFLKIFQLRPEKHLKA